MKNHFQRGDTKPERSSSFGLRFWVMVFVPMYHVIPFLFFRNFIQPRIQKFKIQKFKTIQHRAAP